MMIDFKNWYIEEELDKDGEVIGLFVKFKPKGKTIFVTQTVDLRYKENKTIDLEASYEEAVILRDKLIFKHCGMEALQGIRKGFPIDSKYPSSGIEGISLSRKNGKKTYLYVIVRKFDGKTKSFNLLNDRTEDVFNEVLKFYCEDRKIKGKEKKKLKINPFFGIFVRRELIDIHQLNRERSKGK